MRVAPLLALVLPMVAALAHAQARPASLVNVTDARFAQGCTNAADPLGRQDSTCAIRAAVEFAEGNGIPGGGFPILYFPHGVYHVAGQGYGAAITITKRLSLQGDGAGSTAIVNTSPRGNLLTYLKADGCSDLPGMCPITVQGITFAGQGDKTAGVLVELDSTTTGYMRDVSLADNGGIGLNMQGSSERWKFDDMEILHARWAVVLEGDTNEDYFDRVNVLSSGVAGNTCYSVNCPGGKPINSGVWRPDPHSAVFLDGDNVHWNDSSIKSTDAIGGIRLAAVTSSIAHSYIEGYPFSGQPRLNHAIAAPGPIEIGHLTAAIGRDAVEIPVDDAEWQPLYANDPAQAHINGTHSYTNAYGIFPADYQTGSKEPSRAVPGITRGTLEIIQVAAFSGDGRAHLIKRGAQPVAWPAGSVIEQVPPNGYGVLEIRGNHINSIYDRFDARFQTGCSDTAQRDAGWTSSPSELCAEIIAGVVPDGFMVPFPTTDYVHQGFSLSLIDNSIFFGNTELDGAGWTKIPGNANISIHQVDEPLRTFVDSTTALHSYASAHVQVVQWPASGGRPAASALAYVTDPSAGVRFSPQEGFYQGEVMHDRSLSEQNLGARCWYNMSAGSAAPDARTCADAGGHPMQGMGQSTGSVQGSPVKFTVHDWQIYRLAPRGQSGDCATHDAATGSVHFSTAAEASLIVNVSPNPGAAIAATGAVTGNGSTVALRVCNNAGDPVAWHSAPTVTLTQIP